MLLRACRIGITSQKTKIKKKKAIGETRPKKIIKNYEPEESNLRKILNAPQVQSLIIYRIAKL
jgi:hypothetical protein